MRTATIVPLLVTSAWALWPLPSSVSTGNTTLWIANDVKVYYQGPATTNGYNAHPSSYGDANGVTPSGSQMVYAAIQRTHELIFTSSFVPWKFHPRNAKYEPPTEDKAYIQSIVLKQTEPDPANVTKPLAGEVDESYGLTLDHSGDVTCEASSSVGLVRCLTTFSQLFFKHTHGGSYTPYAPVSIKDAPKFQHRGLNMDVSRNYLPVDFIKRQIDALAFSKMNRLHLHATDAQSWPLEIPSMPELAAKGAYESSLTYSAADLAEIQAYGALQGVEVYVEIDMPGHTSSIWFSHPDLIVAFNEQPNWDTYAAEPPSGTLKLNSSTVYSFLEQLFDDLLPRVKPYTAYMHTGGDEVKNAAYLLDETVRSDSYSVLQPLVQKFVDRNHDQVRKLGLTPIVWEEMLLQWNLQLGSDVVIQSWQSDEAVYNITRAGHKVLAGNYNYWYLDCGRGQWLDFTQNASQIYWPYNDYCAPVHNWRAIYDYDPLEGVPANVSHLVLGGEVHMWAEQIDEVNWERIAWPRTCAAAEVLWSGAKDENGQNRSQIEASPRLSDMRERLVAMGIMAEPIQMPFCTQNGTQCSLNH